MKMKNLVAYAMLALGAVAAPFAAMAADFDGNIRSINAVGDTQQSIMYPNTTAPLSVGQDAYILVRLLNVNYGETMSDPAKVSPWYFKPRTGIGVTTLTNTMYRPMIGLSIGGRRQYATFSETGPNGEVSGPNPEFKYYTDLYFRYTVQPGDLGLPIKMLQANGKVGNDYGEFMLVNVNTGSATYNPWDLTNDYDGKLAKFCYGPQTVSPPVGGKPLTPKPDEVRTYDFSTEGVYVQTVDFDKTNYEGQPWRKGQVWRVVNEDGVTVDGGDRPTVIGSGEYTVYVWSDDDTIAYVEPDGAGSEDFDDGSGRRIVKITGSGTAPVSFKVKAAAGATVDDTVDIYLSSGPSQGYSEVGDKLENSTSVRQVKVGAPSDPYVSITTYTGESKVTNLVATVNYEQEYKLKVSVNKTYAEDLVIALNPKFRDVELSVLNPTNGYVKFLTTVDNPIRSAGVWEVTLKAGKDSAEFYIYALGSAGKAASYLDLTPSIVGNPAAKAYYKGAPKSLEIRLKDQAPDILQPAAGTVYSGREGSVIDGFDVEVADNWRDLQTSLATNGYEIVVEGPGVEKFTTNTVHFTDGGVVTLPVRVNASGTALTATVKVKDPQGNVSSREVKISSTPKPKARVQFYADRDLKQPLAGNTFNEGEIPYVGVTFTEGKAPADMYAFLVPTDANATNLVECDAKTNGLKIAFGDTNSTVMAMNFLDGFTQVNPMKAKFAIRFLSTPTIDGGTPVDYTDDCGSPTFEVNAVNVSPWFDQVFLDGGGIVDGEKFSKVPAGIEKLYTATLFDPSTIDLKSGTGYAGKEIWVRWEYTDDYEGWDAARANYAYSTNGTDGAEVRLSFTYENTLQRVRLYALDKDDRAAQGTSDMKKLNWGKPLFTFYVDVAPTQRIIISDKSKMALGDDGELIFLEDQGQTTGTKGDFFISLSEIPGHPYEGQTAEPIPVRLTLEQWGDGVLNIHTNYVYFKANEKKEQAIRIDTATLNGGQASEWTLTAEVDMDMMSPGAKDSDGNPWDEHFAPAYAEIYVRNVDPVINSAAAKGNRSWSDVATNTVSAGEAVTVTWKITDITNDFYEADWKYDRFQIEWSVDSGETGYENPQVITNDWPRNKGQYSKGQIYGDYRFNVPAQDGYSKITMRVLDGDGGEATKEWWIYVSPAKRLKVDVFGPRATAQSKYKAAKGVGQGLVAAKGTLALCEQFAQTWEYDELTSDADLWAFGYPATNTWAQFVAENPGSGAQADNTGDEGKIPSYLEYTTLKGVPLNRLGNKPAAASPTYYDWATHGDRDPDAGAYDSFFYRWMVIKAAKNGGEGSGGETAETVPSPTLWSFDESTRKFTLDAGNDKKNSAGAASYGTVEVEAIFAKELRPKDNLGDINADGIPDKIVELYGLGADAVGSFPEDDLASLSAFNDDEDFLPNTAGAAIHSSLIPGLPGSWGEGLEFTAKTEVRGFHDGLNDGAKLAGLAQYRFDVGFYSDDVEVRKAARDYSDVEMMAWAEHGYAKDWSPERPTDPTKADTDEDKFPDGYEYYFWYKAHVGYLDANGVHRYLTGRAYDPRNPGEGKFIPAVVIAHLMDPRSDLTPVDFPEGYIDDAAAAKTRDTDNDGLPDLLEFEIGTNPFDFDTDGDGLPDGFEIMISGTDPLKAYTTPGIADGMRNFDGDAMAFTTPKLEEQVMPKPLHTEIPYSFALVEPNGDTDGVQWYVAKSAPTNIAVAAGREKVAATLVTVAGTNYVTTAPAPVCADGEVMRLAADLPKAQTWTAVDLTTLTNRFECLTNLIEVVDNGDGTLTTNKTDYVAFLPTRIAAGAVVTTKAATFAALAFDADVEEINAAWVYGSKTIPTQTTGDNLANQGGYGMLAVGRYKNAPKGMPIAALPAPDENVAYLHYLVYQEFGFDPRTAWNANTPLAARWGTTVGAGENKEVKGNNYTGGYAGIATRTREYTTYDEFLVFSFFLNNGMTVLTYEDLGDRAPSMAELWYANTTNPQGPTEEVNASGAEAEGDSAASEYWGRNDTNGADTDGDGVPDGWELYVMAGPKNPDTGKYVFAMPYLDGYRSSFGPFEPDAASATLTDNSATGGYDGAAGDNDGLTELQEFAGTDSCAWYAVPQGARKDAFSTTIARPAEHAKWLNKFFPTDPWNTDTDGDGLTDGNEIKNAGAFKCANFLYGDAIDTGKTAIPGGGLNPCAIDTDLDGLPDPWEAQFAGKTIYTGAGAQFVKGTAADGSEATSTTVTLQGLCDGMDGTVFDACNSIYVNRTTGTSDRTESKTETVSLNGVKQIVDRDYDKDGLENWQEYLVGAMRCWRYDDPFSRWDYIPSDLYFDVLGNFAPNYEALGMETQGKSEQDLRDEFWYETLFNKTGRLYNPRLVTDQASGAQYFTCVRNGFDPAFTEAGTYYLLYDRVGWNPDGTPTMIGDLWGVQGYGDISAPAPKKYVSCSPILSDTDQDGMDDYYELFHGMNPLLGADGTQATSHGGCDIVYDAWFIDGYMFKYGNEQVNGAPCRALMNLWIANSRGNSSPYDENHMDFVRFPWLNGLETADPDGDDIRNQAESIMAKTAPTSVFLHTDPTPLWMTDSSYTNSLVYRFFRLPTTFSTIPVPLTIKHGKSRMPLHTCDGYMMTALGPVLAPFVPDYWSVTAEEKQNWIVSFEENEGYDSDHDALSDHEELEGNLRGVSDPQDFDSPHRRQAMYFPGKDAALQSMPFVAEAHPRYATGYPDDMSFLQYTVECWVKPESAADATVIERGVWTAWSNPGDQELLRRNFQIAVKNGKWYTKFDSGTLAEGCVEVQGEADIEVGKWTHVAATYDAQKLILYVNGVEAGKKGFEGKGLMPEYGSSAVVVHPGEGTFNTNGFWGGRANGYWFDKEYGLHAFLIGASFKGLQDLGQVANSHLNVANGAGWSRYKDFFKGYIDEVRVWDGARSSLDIKADMKVRYTAALAKANREDFYDQWAAGKYRYDKDGGAKDFEVIPELRYHWSFDSVPGAANAEMAAKVPLGYAAGGVKAPLSRPADWTVGWWSTVLKGYGSVYSDPTWVTWVPNTVTHLPRFDGTTLDSFYWSDDFMGDTAEKNSFARTAEPVSRWTQYVRNGLSGATTADGVGMDFESTGRRFWLANVRGTNEVSDLAILFEFTGRHLNQQGDDLLPLGGAFAKYCDDMWDEQGPSMPWEVSGGDGNGNGLPDWWEEYAKENYLLDPADADNMKWTTLVDYNGRRMTAGQAYLYDLNRGLYADKNGNVRTGDQTYAQTADEDKDGMPDWWEEMNGLHNGATDLTAGGHADGDPDNDGLANISEYAASTGALLGVGRELKPIGATGRCTDGFVLDYFRKLEDGRYLGEVQGIADHDMMEDAWEDLYDITRANRWIWDALTDRDRDGWSNFAECRAGTDPTRVSSLIFEGIEKIDFPIPTVELTLNRPAKAAGGDDTVIVEAWQGGDTTGEPDAVWTVGSGYSGAKSRFLGRNTGRTMTFNCGPGSVVPGSFKLSFKDPTADSIEWNTNKTEIVQALKVNEGENVWASSVLDMQRSGGGTVGDVVWRGDGDTFIGTIDYQTGLVTVDLSKVAGWDWNTWSDDTHCIRTYIDKSYLRADWTSKMLERSVDTTLYLSEPDKGALREGPNTFVAKSADGSLVGIARNVNVGWSEVKDLVIDLTAESAVFPRFEAGVTNGEPALVKIVRKSINGIPSEKIVMRKRDVEGQHLFTEADFVRDGAFDLDWTTLAPAAKEAGVLAQGLTEVEYEVTVDGETLDTFTKTFESVRTKPAAFSPTADQDNLLLSVSPTFRWTGPAGYTAFRLQVSTNGTEETFADGVVYDSGARFMTALRNGTYEFAADCYLNEQLESGRTYFWRVAMLNAKFTDAEDGWSQFASFAVAADSTRLNTGYGKAAVDVRYYGSNDCTRADVVVGLYRSADFTDAPVALQHLADGDLALLAVTNVRGGVAFTTNSLALFDGLKPGTYYVMAFIDANMNGIRDAWESWGYFNNIGTGRSDLYTPMTIDVVANRVLRGECVLFMEDTDVNKDGVPDCWQDLSDWSQVAPSVEDADLDGDGLPDDWEDLMGAGAAGFPTDNPETDAAYAAAGDVMAYAEVDRMLVTFEDNTQALVMRGVKSPTPGDLAKSCNNGNYEAVYAYGDKIGLGLPVTISNTTLRITKVEDVKVALVHAQVYAEFGYEMGCAVADRTAAVSAAGAGTSAGESAGSTEHPHTKPFTALDKYLVWTYLRAIGYTAETEEIAANWAAFTLKPGDPDNNRDGVADGWQLYVMFGPAFRTVAASATAPCTPWTTPDDARTTTPGKEGLTWVQEYDGGYYPTDPWQVDTDKDGVIDYYAYLYHLKGDDAGKDFDGDGLVNNTEYLISEVFQVAKLDPDNPKTDGACIDYFRKMGDLYVGEIFTDHDQVDDLWEKDFAVAAKDGMPYANRYVYDPLRDADNDGWSNYAEAQAGTDPSHRENIGVDGYVYTEHPVPMIKASVTYNGNLNAIVAPLVFKAWNEKTDADMTSVPDAIWTVAAADGGDEMAKARTKYVGKNPCATRTFTLGPGSVSPGSVRIYFRDQGWKYAVVRDGRETASYVGDSASAKWYPLVQDQNGELFTSVTNQTEATKVGSVDYMTGRITLDFGSPALTRSVYASIVNATENNSDGNTDVSSLGNYWNCEKLDLAKSYVKFEWNSTVIGTSVDGCYYLGDADAVSSDLGADAASSNLGDADAASSKGKASSRGYVREGLTKFVCFADLDGSGEYTAGEPFGFVAGVDVGWQGASFSVDLTDTHPVFARISLKDGSSDRALSSTMASSIGSNELGLASAPSGKVRVRVVRTAVNGKPMWEMKNPLNEYEYAPQTVVMDKTFDTSVRAYLHEGDFITGTTPDIDWHDLADDASTRQPVPGDNRWNWPLDMTRVTYRIVFGDGLIGASATNPPSFKFTVDRTFDTDYNSIKTVIAPFDSVVTYNTRPVFRWAITSAGANFTSYPTFVLEVFGADGTTKLYDSGLRTMPAYEVRNGLNYYVWVAPSIVDNLLVPNGRIERNGTYKWRVTVYNSKFRDGIAGPLGTLTTAVNVTHDIDDHACSAIPVTVKYAGPANVLSKAQSMGTMLGKVRVQAFATADFSGEPLSEALVTNDLADTSKTVANGKLYGLPVNGSYYLRAYIDSNGNLKKDDWESWGAAGEVVAAGAQTPAGIWIEDADTDDDWLPDAWEFAANNWKGTTGWLNRKGKDVSAEFHVTQKLKEAVEAANLSAGISSDMLGTPLTVFTYDEVAILVCGSTSYGFSSVDDIRKAVAKKIKPDTLKITSITLDPNGTKVVLGLEAAVAQTIAGQLISKIYDFTGASTTVRVKVYKKENLIENWSDTPVCVKDVTIIENFDELVDVPITGVDMSSGFFKVEVEEVP